MYLDSAWLIPLPRDISPIRAMAIGIAGYTAALSVLKSIGAQKILSTNDFKDKGKALQKESWATIDTLGGNTLANIFTQIKYNGVVTACGMAQNMNFPSNVAPFILRGITLFVIDSVMNSIDNRIKVWILFLKKSY